MSRYHVLRGHENIATTTVGAVVVSTVRLRPGLYETMVLNATMVDLEMVRHHSHVSAVRGHMAMVAKVQGLNASSESFS